MRKKFPQAHSLEILVLFLESASTINVSQPYRDDEILVQLELACKAVLTLYHKAVGSHETEWSESVKEILREIRNYVQWNDSAHTK